MHAPRSRSRVRCTSIIRARNSWIGGRASPSHKSRAGNNRRDERGSTACDAFARSRSPGVASAGLLMPCQVLSKYVFWRWVVFEMLRSAAARQSASTTMEAVPACGQGAANARTRNNREDTVPLASTAADRGSRANDGTARRVLRAQNSGPDGAGLWNRPYTLWRADRPAICDRNAVVH